MPFFGNLFKSETRSRKKTNLMVFLRPVVVRDAAASDTLSLDRYDLMRGTQKDAQPATSKVVPVNEAPVLPPVRPPRHRRPCRWASLSPPRCRRPPASPTPPNRRVLHRHPLPYAFARTYQLLLEDDGRDVTLWHAGAPDTRRLGRDHGASTRVRQVQQLEPGVLAQRISAVYAQGESNAAAVVSEVGKRRRPLAHDAGAAAVEDLLETSDDAPIIRMLNALLTQAARDGASDIHIEPYERHSSVRFRVDGTLREVVQPNRALHAALISRLKIMAELDIAEKRLPQDGRISLRIGTRAVDVRVSTLPSAHGERAVLRLLDKTSSKISLEAVGMEGEALRRVSLDLISQPHGIILVTGPTRLGQDHHAVCGAAAAGTQPEQHHDGGRPDRVRTAGRGADAGQRQDRPHVCQSPARHPAARPGRHHDR